MPCCAWQTPATAASVKGTKQNAMPMATSTMAGSTPVSHDEVAVTVENRPRPAAASTVPTMSSGFGPVRPTSCEAAPAEPARMTAKGRKARPALSGL